MYKRSSKFHNKLWPAPRASTRKAEKANADLLRHRAARTPPRPAALSCEEKEDLRANLRHLLRELAGSLSAAELLRSLPSADIEELVSLMERLEEVPPPRLDIRAFGGANNATNSERTEISSLLLPFVDELLREARADQERGK